MLTRISPALAVASCDQQPLGVVLRPDADALAGFEPEAQQRDGQVVGAPLQLAIGPAHVLVPDDQRFALAEALDDPVEAGAQRFAEQRLRAAAVHVARIRCAGS